MTVNRLHLVMSGLLYPAILGTFIYSAVEKINRDPDFLASEPGLLVSALIAHFAMDYLYTADQPMRSEDYGVLHFLLDLAIVACLFFALRSALGLSPVPWGLLGAAGWLVLTKLAALLWEMVELGDGVWNPVKRLELAMDGGFAVVYLGLRVGYPDATGVLAVVVLADAACYWLHDLRSGRIDDAKA